jgi:hypothetical protein
MQTPDAQSSLPRQRVPGAPQPRGAAKQGVQQRLVLSTVTKTLHICPGPHPAPHTWHEESGAHTDSSQLDPGGHSRSRTTSPPPQAAVALAPTSHTRTPSRSPQQIPASGVHEPASGSGGSERMSVGLASGTLTPPSDTPPASKRQPPQSSTHRTPLMAAGL